MISVTELCRRRKIGAHDISTPLLLPSLSSKGFPEVSWIWDNVKEFLVDTALVSSYDINYGFIPAELDTSNLLFIDSGGYEARVDYDLSEAYATKYTPNEWSLEQYLRTLKGIRTQSAMVVVSFDEWQVKRDLGDQICRAHELFAECPNGTARDLLVKPSSSEFISLEDINPSIRSLGDFDIIGVTEKELGGSLVERLTNVVGLRMALTSAGIDRPIHIFGCLDPFSVWLFYLCGADIFDGLSWLRFVFRNGIPIYRNTWSILAGHAQSSNAEVFLLSLIHNVKYLHSQRVDMIRYSDTYDTGLVPLANETVFEALKSVGVTLEGGKPR